MIVHVTPEEVEYLIALIEGEAANSRLRERDYSFFTSHLAAFEDAVQSEEIKKKNEKLEENKPPSAVPIWRHQQ